jgi:sugar phosphate isomerase/epimerase
LVKLELDVGWMVSGGHDPVDYLARYPDRYVMLHIKDLKRDFIPNTQLKMTGTAVGSGIIDWKSLFAAARKARIHALYVEQEAPYVPSALQSVKASFGYLKSHFPS